MNPSWIKTQADRQKVYREYMASLNLEQQNINKTADALKVKQLTGEVPKMRDTRTTTEKYMDIYRLKNELESGLYELMSPDEAAKVVGQLTDDEVQFGRTQLPIIVKDLKPRFELGVPSIVFINYLRKLLQKFIATEGVENAVGHSGSVPSNALLSSFADIKATRESLERLQQALNKVRQMTPPSSSTELVLYTGQKTERVARELDNIIRMLPTTQELQRLRQIELNARYMLYDYFTDFERYFPNQATIDNIIKDILRAAQRNDVDEVQNIIDSLETQIILNEQQQEDLKQIQNIISESGGQGGQEEVVPLERRAGGNKIVIRGDKEKIKIRRKKEQPLPELEGTQLQQYESIEPSAEEQRKAEEPEVSFKTYKIADKELGPDNIKRLEMLEYKPLTRDEFIKLTPIKKHVYIAKALLKGDIDVAYGFVDEKDNNGNYYQTILTPKLVLTDFREGKEGEKRRLRMTPSQSLEVYDKYLSSKMPQEPILEVSGRSPPARLSQEPKPSSRSVSSGMTSKESTSMGRGIKGRGLSKNRVVGRLEREPEPRSVYSFAPIGRYVINTNKLQKNILTINTKTGKSLPRLKSKTISKKLAEIFKEIAKGNEITNEQTNGLTEDEIDTLYNTLNECQLLSKYNSPTSQNLSNTEKELQRFMILKGQILAGQNNQAVVKEFKALLLKYMKKGQIPRSEGYDILEELLLLGY